MRDHRSPGARSFLIAVLGCAALGCSDERGSARSSDERTGRAINGAISFLSQPAHLYTHAAYYFLNFLHRRFDIAEFADTPERYREFKARTPKALESTGIVAFERLIDPRARLNPEHLTPSMHEVDRFTVAALYCDQVPVPESYLARIPEFVAEGGYALTHVALAIEWLEENGCKSVPAGLRAQVAEAIASGLKADDRLDDVEIERSTFLFYMGRGDLVPAPFVASLLPAQNSDGGWPELWPDAASAGSDWHPTVLALWTLLESEGRSNGAPMIPPRE